MNNELIYTLDPVIVRILFKTKSDEETLEIFNEIAEGVSVVYEETIKDYMLENGFNDEDVQNILNSVDFENIPAKYKPYIQNVILQTKIENNTKIFIKTYYDQLIPKLDESGKKQLEEYLKESEAIIKTRQEEVREGLALMKQILEENGVNNYEELKEKMANSSAQDAPKVNLGGIQTTSLPNQEVQPEQPEQPEQPAVQEASQVEVQPESQATPADVQTPDQQLGEAKIEEPKIEEPQVEMPQPVAPVAPEVSQVEAPRPENPQMEPAQPEVSQVAQAAVEPTNPVENVQPAENNASTPFDWNSLILEQIETNNDGSQAEAVNNNAAPVVEGSADQAMPAEPVAPIAAPIVTEAPVNAEGMPEQNQMNAAALADNLGISENPPVSQEQPQNPEQVQNPEQPTAGFGQPVNPQ